MSTQKIGAWVGKDAKDASEGNLSFQEIDSKKWEETDVDGESPRLKQRQLAPSGAEPSGTIQAHR